MQKTDMHQAYIRSLMYVIGGVPRAGETARWLENLSKNTEIGLRSLQAAYNGQWISKNKYVSDRTLEILEQAAENARPSHDLITFTERQIAIWETTPELFQQQISMARAFVDDLRQLDLSARSSDIGAAAEATGFSAAEAT